MDNKTSINTRRNYSIELLRIFCMLGIVATHTEGYFAESTAMTILSKLQAGAVVCFNNGVLRNI